MENQPEHKLTRKMKITTEGDDLTPFEMATLVLSLYVLGVLFFQTAFRLEEGTNRLLNYIDTIICFIFIYDFFQRLVRSRERWAFLRWNWVDLVSSIPMIDLFRIGRVFRVFRILRVLRTFRSAKNIAEFLFENRIGGILATVSLVALLLTLSSSIIILNIETIPESNINTPAEALLWSFGLLTTVGITDLYPETIWGKGLGVILMVMGITLVGTYTGYVATVFIEYGRGKRGDGE